MAGAYPPDKPGGKWRSWWTAEDGRKRSRATATTRDVALKIARKLEDEAAQVRAGLLSPHHRERAEAALRRVEDHVEDYRLDLLARGDTAKHAGHTAGAIRRLLKDASVESVARISPEAVQGALGRLRAVRSPRTANHAIQATKAFLVWLADNHRIEEAPRGVMKIRPYNEDVDRKRVRRALSVDELAKLLAAAEAGPTIVARRAGRGGKPTGWLTGPDRAWLYRLAMETGFRANELRSLTPESFDLTAATVTVAAAYSKHKREDAQPIRRDLVAALPAWLEGKPPGEPVLEVPEKTASMLRDDLARAGIPYEVKGRVVDFHALRASYITHLIKSGANVKAVQTLARHSTVTLTLDLYTHLDESDLRDALEGDS